MHVYFLLISSITSPHTGTLDYLEETPVCWDINVGIKIFLGSDGYDVAGGSRTEVTAEEVVVCVPVPASPIIGYLPAGGYLTVMV